MQPYSDQTIWNMEDSLKRFENAKWPKKNGKWKMTSKTFKMEDDINLNIFEKGKWKLKTTWKKFKMQDDLFFFWKWP